MWHQILIIKSTFISGILPPLLKNQPLKKCRGYMIIGKLNRFPDQIITKLYVHGTTRLSPSFSVIAAAAAAAADCLNTYTSRDFLKESNQSVHKHIHKMSTSMCVKMLMI